MKRQGQLLEKIADLHNLYEASYKAQKGKISKHDVYAYSRQLQQNLLRLQQQLISGAVETGGYHTFTIYDPKKRLICATPFSQRVLHHALMNICHASFDKHQIATSFASRSGKGTYAALDHAREHNRRYRWFLKLDVRKYFESIDHTILKQQLRRLFKDKLLLSIFGKIIDSYSTAADKSVIIGTNRPGMLLRKKMAEIGLDVEYIMEGEKLEFTEETLEMNAAVRRKLADMKYRIEQLEKELRDIPGLESEPDKKKKK